MALSVALPERPSSAAAPTPLSVAPLSVPSVASNGTGTPRTDSPRMWSFRRWASDSRLRTPADFAARFDKVFDGANPEHQAYLRRLWSLAWPDEPWAGVVHDKWTTIGFQRSDPVSDLRGAGLLGVRNIIHFVENYPEAFARAVASGPTNALAIAGLNVTLLLRAYLGLHHPNQRLQPVAPGENAKAPDAVEQRFLAWLDDYPAAFEELHSCFLETLALRWEAARGRGASLLDFPPLLAATRAHVAHTLGRLPSPWGAEQLRLAARRCEARSAGDWPIVRLGEPPQQDEYPAGSCLGALRSCLPGGTGGGPLRSRKRTSPWSRPPAQEGSPRSGRADRVRAEDFEA